MASSFQITNKMLYYFKILFLFLFSSLFLLIINAFKLSDHQNAFELNDYQNAINDAIHWEKEKYPNPSENPSYCGRPEPSFVCDPDRGLSIIEGK